MSFPRYPKHKPSLPSEALAKAGGAEWLGEVPTHWDVKRIGYNFNERREKVL